MPQQRITDQLQVAIPLLQRLHVTARQQQQDAAEALAALERIVTILKANTPVAAASRPVAKLELAITRTGHSIPEVSFLAGIPESRLRALIHGDTPTASEREALEGVLPEWSPKPRQNGGPR